MAEPKSEQIWRIYKISVDTYPGWEEPDNPDLWSVEHFNVLGGDDAMAAFDKLDQRLLAEEVDINPEGDFQGYSGPMYRCIQLREIEILAETD